ncbi:MAG: hypothetical protein LDL19_00090 [Thiobacillus sp.]|nr:hypothetical protein [Thiobacillus sp.]
MQTRHRGLSGLVLVLWLAACGESEHQALSESGAAGESSVAEAKSDKAACEPYLKFCLKANISGAVAASGVAGFGGSKSCSEWAAGGAARVLELPTMLPMGDQNKITVGLTRIGEYNGPGVYALASTRQGSIPDMLPALDTGERSFGDGTGSSATVRINADGSGILEADQLVEIKSASRMREPDPAARVKLSMRWTCRDSQ